MGQMTTPSGSTGRGVFVNSLCHGARKMIRPSMSYALTKLAAMAAGISRQQWDHAYCIALGQSVQDSSMWSPLTSDAHAFELVNKLDLWIERTSEPGVAVAKSGWTKSVDERYDRHGNDKGAATRLAIVRAAATVALGQLHFADSGAAEAPGLELGDLPALPVLSTWDAGAVIRMDRAQQLMQGYAQLVRSQDASKFKTLKDFNDQLHDVLTCLVENPSSTMSPITAAWAAEVTQAAHD